MKNKKKDRNRNRATTVNAARQAMKVAREITARSPDSVAASKELFQSTWMVEDDATCLEKETTLQLKLIGTWNQAAAAGRQFGINLPYWNK